MTETKVAAKCGCGVGHEEASAMGTDNGRRSVGVDAEIKAGNLRRLRRIEGQIRGLQRMVEEERYCADILTQLSSVQEALRAVGREVMRNHLRYCATTAIKAEGETAEQMYDELIDLMYKSLR